MLMHFGPLARVVGCEVDRMFRTWRRRLHEAASAERRAAARHRYCVVDALEARQLLSTLYIYGSTTTAGSITLSESGGTLTVSGAARLVDYNNTTVTQFPWSGSLTPYTGGSIIIYCGGFNDSVSCTGTINVDTVVHGGAGNDWISTLGGNDTLFGEGGNDTLYSDGGNDSLDGGDGNDELHGMSGNDTLTGGTSADSIAAGAGDDLVYGGAGNDTITGLDGNDTIDGGGGSDSLDGGDGIDLLSYESVTVSVTVTLNPGISSSDNDAYVAYFEALTGSPQADTLTGSSANDTIDGGAGPDVITGDVGDDLLSGGTGNDTIYAGGGNDTVHGNDSLDMIYGQGGNDLLYGDGMADSIVGGGGNDTIDGDGASDSLDGGDGVDLLSYATATAGVVVNLATPSSSDDAYVLNFEALTGSPYADSLTGSNGNDTIDGGAGNDTINGGTGADLLYGGTGDDTFASQEDSYTDTIRGDEGNDALLGFDTIVGQDWTMSDSAKDDIAGLREYYVSNTGGNDANAGTGAGSPWATIQHALDTVSPGDVINIAATGVSYEQSAALSIRAANLTLQGYGTGMPVIDLPWQSAASPTVNIAVEVDADNDGWDPLTEEAYYTRIGTIANAAFNTRLRGLEISGGYFAVKVSDFWIGLGNEGEDKPYHGYFRTGFGATGVTIEDCNLHDSAYDVVKLTPGCDNSAIRRSNIHDSGQADRRDNTYNAEGIDAVNVDDALVEDCQVYNTTTNGIYYKGGSQRTLIQRNYVHDVGTGYSGIILGQDADWFWFDQSVEDDAFFESVDGTAQNNIVANCSGAGIMAWAAQNAKILNNTLIDVGSSTRAGIQIASQGPDFNGDNEPDIVRASEGVTILNNIISMTGGVIGPEQHVGRPVISINVGGLEAGEWPAVDYNVYYIPSMQLNDGAHAYFEDKRTGAPAYYESLAEWRSALPIGNTYRDISSIENDDPVVNLTATAQQNDRKPISLYHLVATSPCLDTGTMLLGVARGVEYDFDGQLRTESWDIGADEV